MRKLITLAALSAFCTTAIPALADSHDKGCSVVGMYDPQQDAYYGPTFCAVMSLNRLSVYGPLELNGTQISGLTRVSGPINAMQAQLQDIYLEKNITQKVILQNSTVVAGNITFAPGPAGIVYLQSGSVIKGRVINGTIVHN